MRESGSPSRRGAVFHAAVAIDPRPPLRGFCRRRSSAAIHALFLSLLMVLAAAGASTAIRAAIEAIDLVPIPPFLRPAVTLFSLFTARTIIGDTVDAIRKLLELLLLLMRVRTKLESRLILWISTN
ncbi:uncharacterized protein DS421_15g503280 [Arachis hypogaea]|nr:uncharacterized protein DS421_15g503280 [Arachis hypogaea]